MMIRMVYFACIFGWQDHKVAANLKAFDETLRAFPELFVASNDIFIPSNHFPFWFVREWRKHKNCLTWRFLLFRAYAFAVARINRIRRRG